MITLSCAATDIRGTRIKDVTTTFQQNSQKDVAETAADMFLNWVYRRISAGTTFASENEACNAPIGDPTAPTWEGFQNIDRIGNLLVLGTSPERNPGNMRFWWLDAVMQTLASENSNWENGWQQS